MRRAVNWDEFMAPYFKKKSFRKTYLVNLIEEDGLSIEDALIESIKAMGIKEFAKLVDMAPSNVSRIIHGKDMMLSTFKRFLKAFDLSLRSRDIA